MKKSHDLAQKRFGALVALSKIPGRGHVKWMCQCDCGKEKPVFAISLISGDSKSCGCRIKPDGCKRDSHGMTGTRIHDIWMGMRDRCQKPRNDKYPYYGGRGIKVCLAWESFNSFLDDMGVPPSPTHTLDRINNDGDYEPGNVRWATRGEQMLNRRPAKIWTVLGVEYKSRRDAAAAHGVREETISSWCNGVVMKGIFYPPRTGCLSSKKNYSEAQ